MDQIIPVPLKKQSRGLWPLDVTGHTCKPKRPMQQSEYWRFRAVPYFLIVTYQLLWYSNSKCGIQKRNDMEAHRSQRRINLPSPEQSTSYQHAVVGITWKTTLLVLFVHKKQAKDNEWETIPENKIPLPYPALSALPLFRLSKGYHNLQRQLSRTGFSDLLTVQRRRRIDLEYVPKMFRVWENMDNV